MATMANDDIEKKAGPSAVVTGPPEPPVVARLVVEIRSDGSTTIARGAIEDLASGEKVAIEAKGTTPLHLAMGLAKSMMKGKSLARRTVAALLPLGKKRRE